MKCYSYLVFCIILGLSSNCAYAQNNPAGFRLNFVRASLTFDIDTNSNNLALRNSFIASVNDWEVRRIKPYLFHIRPKNLWDGFFWRVNSSRRRVDRIIGGTFGEYGGKSIPLAVRYRTMKGSDRSPERFSIAFPKGASLLFFRPKTFWDQTSVSVFADLTVVARKSWWFFPEWDVARVRPFLFHMRHKSWSTIGGFYWKINTSRRSIFTVTGGILGRLGGAEVPVRNTTVIPF